MTLDLPVIGGTYDNVIGRVSVSVQNGRAETMYAIAGECRAIAAGGEGSGRYTKEEIEEAATKAGAYERDFFAKAFRQGEPLWQAYNHTVEWFDSLSDEDQAYFRSQGWNRDAYVARVDYWRSNWPEATAETLGRPGRGGGGTGSPDAHLKDPKWQSVMKMFREMEANYSAWMKDQGRRWGILQTSGLERQDIVDLSPEAMQHLQETAAEAESVKA